MRAMRIGLAVLMLAASTACGTANNAPMEATVTALQQQLTISQTQVAELTRPTATAATPQPSPTPPQVKTYSDPWAYCVAVGTIDEPDKRYTGPEQPAKIRAALQIDGPQSFRWRCVNQWVKACDYGANIPCWKALDNSTVTLEMVKQCQQQGYINRNHGSLYEWDCKNRQPVIAGRNDWKLEQQGFIVDFWRVIQP